MTSLEAITIILNVVETAKQSAQTPPNGKVYKLQRVSNSQSEDIVINVLNWANNDVNEGLLNVNLFVPNLELQNEKIEDNLESVDRSMPNTKRMGALATWLNEVLGNGEEIYAENGDYCYKIQGQQPLTDENDQHFYNFRIEFFNPQY